VDEAALTGESLPVKVPREDEADKFVDEKGQQQTKVKLYSGRFMYSGAILKVGECQAVVGYTGVNTLIGEAAKAIQEAGGHEVGVFEQKIINAAKVLIVTTGVVVIGLFVYMFYVQHAKLGNILEMCISLVIASVPVALPMVMKVTLSLGAKEMADEGGIVTHLTALEEIASMKVLCSDKTGTLTTAQMTVYYDNNAKCFNGFSAKEVLEFGSIASNDANKDDPIDSAVLRAYTEMVGAQNVHDAVELRNKKYSLDKEGFDGFNPIVKRTCARVTSSDGRKYLVAKGMVDVILATDKSDEGKEQWKVENFDKMNTEVRAADAALGMSGFKTLAVMVKEGNGPHKFAGILPIMDPPRKDTKDTIANIKESGVAVKMITGDHHNIAKQLAAQINLGDDIRTPSDLAAAKNVAEKEHLALQTDGFAKVKPIDKHTVVSTLQHVGLVVGMTGDGVNDAPALAQAQIGVAVHGATDAAKSAGDIVLTRDGLSPIYTAIQISRRIFKRLKSYVIYRIGITVQVVFFLAALAIIWNLTFKPLYIILLALFHDLQIVTIAYDKQVAGKKPETPTVTGLLLQSWSMGFLMFLQSILIVSHGHLFLSDKFKAGYEESMTGDSGSELNGYMETTLFLQISNSSAILILSARTVSFFFTTMPAWQLLFSTALGQLIINLLVIYNPCLNLVVEMVPKDVLYIWIYDFSWLLVLDIVKMAASAVWEKFKPAAVDANPALVHEEKQARASRRMSNRIGTNNCKVAAGAHAEGKGSDMKKRLSQRASQRNA
jgi:H+-transporting ATPase